MRRRDFVTGMSAWVGSGAWAAASDWEQRNYPTGWGQQHILTDKMTDKTHRVGNYSGGFEQMLRVRKIAAGPATSPLRSLSVERAAAFEPVARQAASYMKAWPVSGLLIARKGTVLFEGYQFERKPEMRMTSWSMAKSVTSLLLGICMDRGLVYSLDDKAQDYVPQLRGTLHGRVTLRNLGNMSSGAAIVHHRDNRSVIYPRGLLGSRSDLEAVVRDWNSSQEPQGTRFNYNELCPLTIGMVIRQVTGRPLAAFCEEALWRPLGAEGDATWLCDDQGHEFNCVGFAARLRDWARLAQLVAQRGNIQGRQVVSERWIEECASWTEFDAQVRYGAAATRVGYKLFFWHGRADGSWMMMVGHDGQRIIVERGSQTVLVQTAIDESAAWVPELNSIMSAAITQRLDA